LIIKLYVENGSKSSPEFERELSKRDNALEINKKLQYASKHIDEIILE